MDLNAAHQALKKYFGYDSFRPMQADIVEAIYKGRDSLVLMPTGGGKSICFQIPAMTMEGICVVISPLISLMKDQVEGLIGNGIPAAYLNSSQESSEQRDIENRLFSGKLKLLYVSPEKLVSGGLMPMLKSLKINLFAIDEAHCISSWGHDFRPEYTQLRLLREQFPGIPIVALTATADKITRRDIATQLGLAEPEVFVASFDRPNLSLTVSPGQKRFEQILDFLKKRGGQSGIIYCLSKKTCEDLSEKLKSKKIPAAFYHAGMSPQARSKIQEDFINDRMPIICATVAFGMGIDKSNVRWVIHYNLPKNIEGYYQEIGRSGRDGVAADTLLFSSYGDLNALRDMLSNEESHPQQREIRIAKLERMFEYAEAKICRRRILLAYFSEDFDRNCGNCDVCKNPPVYIDGTTMAQMALSAVVRCNEKVGMTLLIDVLRGSHRHEIVSAGFDKIKTWGVGHKISVWEWTHYLGQLLQLGLLEIAYDQGNVLRLTEAAKPVLYEKKPVSLVKPQTKAERDAEKDVRKFGEPKEKPVFTTLGEELFERFKLLRRALAQERGVPPYLIFSDASLQNMAELRPLSDHEMLQVSGMGEKKLQLYGESFLDEILKFCREKGLPTEPKEAPLLAPKPAPAWLDSSAVSTSKPPVSNGKSLVSAPFDEKTPKTSTYQQTWELWQAGKNVVDIANERGLSPNTIFSHLTWHYERGEDLPIEKWIKPEELDIIGGALPQFEPPFQLTMIYEHFESRYSYEQIRLAIAHVNRQQFLEKQGA